LEIGKEVSKAQKKDEVGLNKERIMIERFNFIRSFIRE
jgi:stress response protein YsnF